MKKLFTRPNPQQEQFEKRYARNWTRVAARARRATNNICCLCRSRRAVEVHHARYSRNGRAIAGKEKIGVDIFPLCKNCHKHIAHSPKNWIRDRSNQALGNRNNPVFVKQLQSGFKSAKKMHKLKPQANFKGANLILVALVTAVLIFAIHLILNTS